MLDSIIGEAISQHSAWSTASVHKRIESESADSKQDLLGLSQPVSIALLHGITLWPSCMQFSPCAIVDFFGHAPERREELRDGACPSVPSGKYDLD